VGDLLGHCEVRAMLFDVRAQRVGPPRGHAHQGAAQTGAETPPEPPRPGQTCISIPHSRNRHLCFGAGFVAKIVGMLSVITGPCR
jgi:hypothetical protein